MIKYLEHIRGGYSFKKGLFRALTGKMNLVVLAAAAGFGLLHSYRYCRLGCLAYVTLVILDLSNRNFWRELRAEQAEKDAAQLPPDQLAASAASSSANVVEPGTQPESQPGIAATSPSNPVTNPATGSVGDTPEKNGEKAS